MGSSNQSSQGAGGKGSAIKPRTRKGAALVQVPKGFLSSKIQVKCAEMI